MYNFDIAFVQDFKNYTKDVVILENRKYNMQFWLYNFIHKSHSFNFVTNNTFVKRNSDDGMSITIESNQKGFNGLIKIKFNLIYLGKIDDFNINFDIVWNLLITLIWLYWLHIKILDVLEDDFSYMWLSPITIALSLTWNTLLLFEHFYLALTWEEYFRLYIPMIFHLWIIVYQYYLLKFIYSRFEQKFTRLQYQIFICIVLFVFSTAVFSYDLLFDWRFLTILWGFIWIPQIILNVKNGFTINNDGLILSLSLNFIFFPLSTKLWNSNIFELQPNYEWTKTLLFWVLTQVLIWKLQEMWNWRFFINNWIKFKEVKILDLSENNFEWVIWLSDTENNSDSKDISILNSKIVKTSCEHSFHYLWLKDCIKYKNEWPLCRQKVFWNQIDRKRFHFYG